jgi:cytochrome c biogenesis protein CcmG, thiol:disulfide interchange protein DsbE|tara:strand:- start:743 stop:1261 length:519 start_codon:yes stop_codon:yes gene_type:complete
MKFKFLSIIIVIFFLAIFSIFYIGLQNLNIYVPKENIGQKIPSLKIKTFNNDNEISLDKIFYGNKFYLMNIWSSWCGPCKDEHKFLMELNKNPKLEIIGLNYKDKDVNAKNFLKQFKNPYKTIIKDKNGTIAIEWGAYGVPESFLVRENKVIKKIIGPLNKNLLIEIENIIK